MFFDETNLRTFYDLISTFFGNLSDLVSGNQKKPLDPSPPNSADPSPPNSADPSPPNSAENQQKPLDDVNQGIEDDTSKMVPPQQGGYSENQVVFLSNEHFVLTAIILSIGGLSLMSYFYIFRKPSYKKKIKYRI